MRLVKQCAILPRKFGVFRARWELLGVRAHLTESGVVPSFFLVVGGSGGRTSRGSAADEGGTDYEESHIRYVGLGWHEDNET